MQSWAVPAVWRSARPVPVAGAGSRETPPGPGGWGVLADGEGWPQGQRVEGLSAGAVGSVDRRAEEEGVEEGVCAGPEREQSGRWGSCSVGGARPPWRSE